MKTPLCFIAVLFFCTAFSQLPDEETVLRLSNTMFKWEVEENIDSLANLFDDKLNIVNSRGEIQTKEQYLKTLRSGSFKHDSIYVEQSIATAEGNTATVIGKGRFVMTVSGNQMRR